MQNRENTIRESGNGAGARRAYKARLFEMIFSDRKELLALYNAVNGTAYEDPEQLEVNTLENAIYMSMRNDLSFIIDSRLTLYEHQSTYSPNLPLRCLMYAADLYSVLTREENLYGTKLVKLPTPRFVIFYNGRKDIGDLQEMKLSEAFTVAEEEYSLELRAILLNINKGHNERLLSACKTLGDYAEYTERVRTYAGTMSLKNAVERAVEECIRDNVLAEFLKNNRAEAMKVSIYEYDEEKTMRQMREEGHEEGVKEGREEGREEGEKSFAILVKRLLEDSRQDDLLKAADDREFRELLYREYGLKEDAE
nr:hypothetical protein [uncultured Clostridium sp.]